MGYAIYTGLKRIGNTFQGHDKKIVTKEDAMEIFHSIYRDLYGMHTISNVFIEASLNQIFIEASILTEEDKEKQEQVLQDEPESPKN